MMFIVSCLVAAVGGSLCSLARNSPSRALRLLSSYVVRVEDARAHAPSLPIGAFTTERSLGGLFTSVGEVRDNCAIGHAQVTAASARLHLLRAHLSCSL